MRRRASRERGSRKVLGQAVVLGPGAGRTWRTGAVSVGEVGAIKQGCLGGGGGGDWLHTQEAPQKRASFMTCRESDYCPATASHHEPGQAATVTASRATALQ